tara:strand:+ start:511 stop:8013 length:7503 start_codon:yes stop_codon:yes gene_type:complete
MANIVSQNSSPTLNLKNIKDLNSTLVERNFGRSEDYIEIHIYDLNNNLLDTVNDFKDYKSEQNKGGLIQDINVDPLGVLNELGYTTGRYNIKVNIQKRKILNISPAPFKIKEISSTRTELKITTVLSSTNINLVNNSRNFIQVVQNSPYLRDFILNFGKDRNVIAVNIAIDVLNPNENVLQIKLLEPLPENLEIGDKLFIAENIVDPVILTYDLGLLPTIDTTIPIKGPNYKIGTRLNSSVPTAFRSIEDILSTSSTSSYHKLTSKLKDYEVPEIDYGYVRPLDSSSLDFTTVTPTHFENFVHFGSATELLKNFKYKLQILETYNIQLNELNELDPGVLNTLILESSSSILDKKQNLIQGFNGYEQFLYYTTGSNPYTWPKTGSIEPYFLRHSTSPEALTWLGSSNSTNPNYGGQLSSASIFDKQNPDRLMKLVPTFIGDREENKPFELFCDMIGEHFDPIWSHIKEITQITDNSHKLGISKNLVYYMLQNLGIEAYDQFENEDLINYIFGQPFNSNDSSTVISGSNETFSKQDITKEIWKRLYNNAPYLLKTKGTERGLRALINCYGIPDTVLDIKEFGSSDPNRDEFKLYTYNKFTQVLTGNSLDGTKKGTFIETAWTSSFTDAISTKPSASAKTVEFRIKPTRSGSDASHLFSLAHHTSQSISSSDLHLILHPYTGSIDFFNVDDRTQYGKLDLLHFTSSILTSSGHKIISPTELISVGGFHETLGSELATTVGATSTVSATINAVDKVTFVSHSLTDFISPIVPAASIIAGQKYKAIATITEYQDFSLTTNTIGFDSQGGLSSVLNESRLTENGTISHSFTATDPPLDIKLFAEDGVAGIVDNISIKQINPEWVLNTDFTVPSTPEGWAIKDGVASYVNSNGNYKYIEQTVNIIAGKTYRITFTNTGTRTINPLKVTLGDDTNITLIYTTGAQLIETIAGSTDLKLKFWSNEDDSDFTNTIDNISIKQILIHEAGYFPVYNGDFWNISLGTDGISGSDSTIHLGAYQANHLRDVLHYTSSVVMDEMTNAESFGNLHYSELGNLVANGTFIESVGEDFPSWIEQDTGGDATFSSISDGFKITIGSSAPASTDDVRMIQELQNKLKLGHKYRLSFQARTSDDQLRAFISTTNGQNHQTVGGANHIPAGHFNSSIFTYYQTIFETTYISDTNNTIDTNQGFNDGNLILHFYLNSAAADDTLEIKNVSIEELSAPGTAYFGGIKDYLTGIALPVLTSSFYTNNNQDNFELKTGDEGAKVQKDLFTLGYKGSFSEIRYYFGELLNHKTLTHHALEPLMYGGNSISSSYDHLILRYPLSFELDLNHDSSSQLPSSFQAWNTNPSVLGTGTLQPPLISPSFPLVGPITGGAILSSSLNTSQLTSSNTIYSGQFFATGSLPTGSLTPIFTIGGIPLLQSHHPNVDINYLDGFTYFVGDNVEQIVEEHHLPTPNTIGKSPVNNKIRIDNGTTDDDILSPNILSQLPSTERQVPDFSNIGVYLSPQNEINEDIIYTLGTFSLDEFLGDPREEIGEEYEDFKPLVNQYFKKLKKGQDRYNVFDFTRWVSFLDHTLFDLIKKFTPQKSIDKTGILIEPHFLERPKFRRHHPIISNTTYEGTFQEITQSFNKTNNISSLDGTSGSAVISYTTFSSSKAHTNYNTSIDVAKVLSGSNTWEQGPIRPIFELVRNPNFTGSVTVATNTSDWRTLANTSIGSGVATIKALGGIQLNNNNWSLNQKFVFPHSNPDTSPVIGTPGNGFEEIFEITFRAKQTTGIGVLQVGMGYIKFFEEIITNNFKTYKVRFKKQREGGLAGKNADTLVFGGSTGGDIFVIDSISVRNLVDTSLEPRRFSRAISGSSLDANFGGTSPNYYAYLNSDSVINGSNKLRPYILTPRGNFLNSKISKIKRKQINEHKNLILIDSSKGNLLSHNINFDNSSITGTSTTIVFNNTQNNKQANIDFGNYLIKPAGYNFPGRKYRLTFTLSGFSGAGDLQPRLRSANGYYKILTTRTGNGTFTETVIVDQNQTNTYYNRLWFYNVDAGNNLTCTISDLIFEEINPLRDVEFEDSLIDLAGWKNSRYDGSKLTGAKINKYTAGDITYGLNPVVEQKSTALYFGKSLIGADEEDNDLVTIRNHSYVDIEKIILIDKYTDKITTIDLKNENYRGINGYIANDFKDGSNFNIEILDDKVKHKLRDSYKAKFNQGYLKKTIEYVGENGVSGSTYGEGIQAGYIDVSEDEPDSYTNSTNTQNVFCYGNHDNTMNSDTLYINSNSLTRQIWPTKDTFGIVSFHTGSTDFVNSGMQQLGTFINSMLIPVASESQYRLFGTMNYGQKQNTGNYTASFNSGIKSISTFEIDLEKYDTTNSTQVSSSLYIDGVNRTIDHPKYYLLPTMQGPHDIMTSGIAVGNGGNTGNSITGTTIEDPIQLRYYWSGEGDQNAIYQFSYLEETNVIIADIDRPTELANNVGDEGYVLIPDNIDKDIRDNLYFYLNKSGLKDITGVEKLPLRKI